MVTEGDTALGGACTMQYTDDALLNCALETRILLTSVNPINLIKNKTK